MQQEPAAISPPFDSIQASDLARLSNEDFWRLANSQAARVEASVHYEEYVECALDGSGHRCWLALDALSQAVPPPHRFALLPAMPPWMVGLVAWHGETLATIDLAAYLADNQQPISGSAQAAQGMLVIMNGTGSFPPSLALLVPAIGPTVTLAPEQVQARNLLAADDAALASGWLAASRATVIRGSYNEAPVLDVAALLADIVECIGIAALDG